MHGTALSIMAEIGIPDAGQCFRVVAPFIAVAALVFIWRKADVIIDRLFPHWDWETKLGWLNFDAQRRADAFMRWLGYFVYALLAVALLGIVWAAEGLSAIGQWNDVHVLDDLLLRIPTLLVCLGFWLLYLGGELIPKMRGQYEEEELEKYRAEQRDLEHEENMRPGSSGKAPHRKHGVNPRLTSNRPRPRR